MPAVRSSLAFLIAFAGLSLIEAQSTCSDLSLAISEDPSGTESYQGTSYPRYSTGRIHYATKVSADCKDSKNVWVSVAVETYNDAGNVGVFAQLPVKTAYTLNHQGDLDIYDFGADAQDFVWFHAYLCTDQACNDIIIDYIGDTIFIGPTESSTPKGTGNAKSAVTPPKPKKASSSASNPNTNSTSANHGQSKPNSAASLVASQFTGLVVFAIVAAFANL